MNLDKSSDNIPEKSWIVKVEAQDNGLKFAQDIVGSGGNNVHVESSLKFDGKDYPLIGSPDGTQSLRRINTNSYEVLTKYYGEEPARVVVVISADGNTSTATGKQKDSEGQEVTSIYVYDKQED